MPLNRIITRRRRATEPVPEVNVQLDNNTIITPDDLRRAYLQMLNGDTRTVTIREGNINELIEEPLQMNDEIRIGDKHYNKDQCIVVEGSWYLKSDPDILTDIFTGEQFHKSRCYTVIDSLEIIDGKPKVNRIFISRRGLDYCQYINSEKYKFENYITDSNNIKGWNFIEDPSRNILVDSGTKVIAIKETKQYVPFKNIASKNILLRGKIGDKSQTYLITEGLQYTFGVEIEVNRGNISMNTAAKGLNISCVRDGSINAGEGGPE